MEIPSSTWQKYSFGQIRVPKKVDNSRKKINDALLFQCVRPDFISKVDDNNNN